MRRWSISPAFTQGLGTLPRRSIGWNARATCDRGVWSGSTLACRVVGWLDTSTVSAVSIVSFASWSVFSCLPELLPLVDALRGDEASGLHACETSCVSPDGKRGAFYAYRGYNGTDIWEMGIDGTNPHQLLVGGKSDIPKFLGSPKWTPDGKYLVFRAAERDEGRWDLWVLPERASFLSGSGKPLKLTNGPLSYLSSTPSRDGKQIFATGRQMRGELVQYSSSLREFVPYLSGISALMASFSKDGKWFAFLSYPDYQLWRARGDGSDRLRLTYLPLPVYCQRISSDGSKVLFSTDEGTFFVGINGGTLQKLNDNGAGCSSWSPDGNLIGLTSKTPGTQYNETGSFQTSIQDLRTGTVTALPNSRGRIGGWFITQDTILGITEDGLSFVLFNFKTQEWSQLYASPDRIEGFYVSPDSNYLYTSQRWERSRRLCGFDFPIALSRQSLVLITCTESKTCYDRHRRQLALDRTVAAARSLVPLCRQSSTLGRDPAD